MSIVALLDRQSARRNARKNEVQRLIRSTSSISKSLALQLEVWAAQPIRRRKRANILRDMPSSLRHQVVYNVWKSIIEKNPILHVRTWLLQF